jgi:hypothetical protein
MNQNRGREICYFSSEMGASEMRMRIEKFGDPFSAWNFNAYERATNFADVIHPDAINIIDFLELSDNFYQVGGQLTAIFNKLKSGVAIVALQKDPRSAAGRGGSFGLEKPRLYMNLDPNPPDGAILKIVKAKNRANPEVNPNHLQCEFKIIDGYKLIQASKWYTDEVKRY